jgi:shikimate dehydrogenase
MFLLGKGPSLRQDVLLMLREVYTLETLSELEDSPVLYAVLGHPVAHSRSPKMQQAAFAAHEIPALYIRLDCTPEELPEAVRLLRARGAGGWNCTLPHKEAMAALVDECGPSATHVQAVNTVVQRDGRLIGHSTDGLGWVRAVREAFGIEVRNLRVLLLGCGGAGRTLAYACAEQGCDRLLLVNRSPAKAAALVAALTPYFVSSRLLGASDRLVAVPWTEAALAEALEQVDLVVNCTAMGLHAGEESPLPARLLQPHHLVYDLIYLAGGTPFLQAAQEAGARASDGLGMLLYQGAASFTLWTGRPAPLAAMREALVVR